MKKSWGKKYVAQIILGQHTGSAVVLKYLKNVCSPQMEKALSEVVRERIDQVQNVRTSSTTALRALRQRGLLRGEGGLNSIYLWRGMAIRSNTCKIAIIYGKKLVYSNISLLD